MVAAKVVEGCSPCRWSWDVSRMLDMKTVKPHSTAVEVAGGL